MKDKRNNKRSEVKQVGLAIADLRKQKGLTQKQLAEKAGISLSYLSKIEAPNVEQDFCVPILFNIASALQVKEWEIFEHSKIFEIKQ